MSKSLTCQSLLFIFLTESDSNGLLLYYLLQVFKKSNVPHISSNLVKNIVIFNNLIISELICPNYLGEIRSHQESGRLTKSPKISPRVRPSHQESGRLTKSPLVSPSATPCWWDSISPRVSPTWVCPFLTNQNGGGGSQRFFWMWIRGPFRTEKCFARFK